MADRVPRRVVLYSYASGQPKAVAEFKWSPAVGVSLTVFIPEEAHIAQLYYERGVPFEAERRAVPRQEAATFMRALVQPSQSTYSQFVDESEPGSP